MANLTETSTWEAGIYQLELTDPVQGGSGGTSNCQPGQLANRTKKIYDTLAANGIFVDPSEQAFVGQPSIVDATFEGTVVDGDAVYYDLANTRFAKALADGSETEEVVGIASVTNSRVVVNGLVQTARSDTRGQILYLSSTTPGEITTTDTGVPIAQYQYAGIIYVTPGAAAAAQAASIPVGSVTPSQLQESYYTVAEIDAKCSLWDAAYSERRQWDGGATNLVAATARTSLGLTGDVTTHCHDTYYYTKTEINTKCTNWDTAYTQTRQWDGGASGLTPATGRASLGLTGDVTTHCHGSYYYTKAEINACCGNWDAAYSERRQWDGGSTNLNASTARTSLGLTGDVTTHCHGSYYYTKTEIDAKCALWDAGGFGPGSYNSLDTYYEFDLGIINPRVTCSSVVFACGLPALRLNAGINTASAYAAQTGCATHLNCGTWDKDAILKARVSACCAVFGTCTDNGLLVLGTAGTSAGFKLVNGCWLGYLNWGGATEQTTACLAALNLTSHELEVRWCAAECRAYYYVDGVCSASLVDACFPGTALNYLFYTCLENTCSLAPAKAMFVDYIKYYMTQA